MFVTALKSFDHNGRINRGTVFECSDIVAHALKRAKLVSVNEEQESNFTLTEDLPPSALPPVPVLPQTIAKPLEDGEPKPKNKRGRKKKGL